MSATTGPSSHPYYVLFVDDEEKTRKAFQRLFADEFKILVAGDGAEGFQVYQERAEEIGVIVTDQKMPKETGIEFLAKVAESNDDVVRILSTAYAELDAAVEGVNKGGIYRYVTKPWDVPELEITLRRAMELFVLRKQQASEATSRGLDLGQLLGGQKVSLMAAMRAASSVDGASRGFEAVSAFLGLLESEGLGNESDLDWEARYSSLVEFLTEGLTRGSEAASQMTALDWSRLAPPSMAIRAAAMGCGGFEVASSNTEANIWPGPAPVLAEALRPLILAFDKLISALPDGSCRVRANFSTMDFVFSSRPLRSGMKQLCTDEAALPVLGELLQGVAQIYHFGGEVSVLADEESYVVRIGFEKDAASEDPYLSVVKQMSANS